MSSSLPPQPKEYHSSSFDSDICSETSNDLMKGSYDDEIGRVMVTRNLLGILPIRMNATPSPDPRLYEEEDIEESVSSSQQGYIGASTESETFIRDIPQDSFDNSVSTGRAESFLVSTVSVPPDTTNGVERARETAAISTPVKERSDLQEAYNSPASTTAISFGHDSVKENNEEKKQKWFFLLCLSLACLLVVLIVSLSVPLTRRKSNAAVSETNNSTVQSNAFVTPAPSLQNEFNAIPAIVPTTFPTMSPSTLPSWFPSSHPSVMPTQYDPLRSDVSLQIRQIVETVTPADVLTVDSPQSIVLNWMMEWPQYFYSYFENSTAESSNWMDAHSSNNNSTFVPWNNDNTNDTYFLVEANYEIAAAVWMDNNSISNSTIVAYNMTVNQTSNTAVSSVGALNASWVLQRYALTVLDVALSNRTSSTNGPVTGYPMVHECDWQGVVCDNSTSDFRSVIRIVWAKQNLTGQFPNELRILSNLKYLDVGENKIKGPIHESIFSLTKLEELYLHQNHFSGTLSSSFSHLQNLTKFFAFTNNLSGKIPQGLGSAKSGTYQSRPLRYLSLFNNQLTGTIPSNLNWGKLVYLDLSSNQLSGTFPSDWVNGSNSLAAIHLLMLDHNQLTGTLPPQVTTLGHNRLEQFYVNDNKFTGNYPGVFESIDMMQNLEIQNNQFTSIDHEVCNLNVFAGGEMVDFKADCNICVCSLFCGPGLCYNNTR